jgi:hypothetical protein
MSGTVVGLVSHLLATLQGRPRRPVSADGPRRHWEPHLVGNAPPVPVWDASRWEGRCRQLAALDRRSEDGS